MESRTIERKWLVVYCKSRNEKLSAERLTNAGVEVYCPLHTTMRQWSDRKKKITIPVFPSYLFVHVNEQERLRVLKDTGVSRFVFWLGKPAVVRENEMQTLKRFLTDHKGNDLQVEFIEGEKIRISEGLFENEEGVYSGEKQGKAIIVLSSIGLKMVANKQNIEKIR
jgi:transcription antitermination factor NusG